jgi:2'-hydroxyisoflavone reductase
LFNRGRHHPELYSHLERLRGDRDGGLAALQGRRWDAVIDTCGYVPRVVQASAELLASAVDHYTFISSISVYAEFPRVPGIDERAAVGRLADATVEEVTGETYGPLKALCEQAVERAMPGRALHIRPGLIAGPFDPSDRFTYWPHRVAQGGEVLAPGRPERLVQFIDARDLAGWIIHLVEAGQTGIYNATGPDYELTMQRLLDECQSVSGSDARFVWVSDEFLLEAGVVAWTEVPLWAPEARAPGLAAADCTKAIASGLLFRPLAVTIRDTLAWDAARPATVERRAGLKPERERQVLEAWRARATRT